MKRPTERVRLLKPDDFIAHPAKPGPEPYEPTERDRDYVRVAVAAGLKQEYYVQRLINPATNKPISLETLRKVFATELEDGLAHLNANVTMSAYRQAVGQHPVVLIRENAETGERETEVISEERKPVPQMTQFWLKAKAGWKEEVDVNNRFPDGVPQSQVVIMLPDNGRDPHLTMKRQTIVGTPQALPKE